MPGCFSTIPARLASALLAGILGLPLAALAQDTSTLTGYADYIEMQCHECHGWQGQGGGNGPRLAPTPYEYEAFARIVRHPMNVMPAYPPSDLSEAKLRRIHEYLQSIPQPPDPDSIPALSLD